MQLSHIFTDCLVVNKLIGLIKHPGSSAVRGGRSLRQREERRGGGDAEEETGDRLGREVRCKGLTTLEEERDDGT